jgi:hypothetical protein
LLPGVQRRRHDPAELQQFFPDDFTGQFFNSLLDERHLAAFPP